MADDEERKTVQDVRDAREAALREWQYKTEHGARLARESGIDWSKMRVDPKDVGVRVGPMLTEAEFKAMQKSSGTKATIVGKHVPK